MLGVGVGGGVGGRGWRVWDVCVACVQLQPRQALFAVPSPTPTFLPSNSLFHSAQAPHAASASSLSARANNPAYPNNPSDPRALAGATQNPSSTRSEAKVGGAGGPNVSEREVESGSGSGSGGAVDWTRSARWAAQTRVHQQPLALPLLATPAQLFKGVPQVGVRRGLCACVRVCVYACMRVCVWIREIAVRCSTR